MASAYDTWKTSEPDEDARDEFVAKRSGELVAQWKADGGKVREAIADALSDDYDDTFAGLLGRLFERVEAVKPADPRGDAYMGEAAYMAWRDLTPYVDAYLKERAEDAAAAEWDKNVAAAADMRAAA